MLPDTYSYPAILYYDPDGVSIEFPDLPGCLPCAETAEAALHNAKEAMGLHLFGMELDGEPIPAPTPIAKLQPDEGGVISLIEAYMPPIRERQKNRMVKKTLTIPSWLNAVAIEKNVNFSQVLQDALRQTLGVSAP